MALPTCVASVPIFQNLDHQGQESIASRLQHVHLQAGEALAMPGDPGALRVVRSGRIRQSRITANGSEQLLRVLSHGQFTGELAVLTGQPEQVMSVALTDSEVCVLSAADLREILVTHPKVSIEMIAEVSTRLARSEDQLTQITGRSVSARLGEYLAGLAEAAKGAAFELPMAKKDLASFLGTTPETLSRTLRTFADKGLISQSGRRITVKEPSRLMLLDS